jgi:hypothetical protein
MRHRLFALIGIRRGAPPLEQLSCATISVGSITSAVWLALHHSEVIVFEATYGGLSVGLAIMYLWFVLIAHIDRQDN